jgi:hypothetical protein
MSSRREMADQTHIGSLTPDRRNARKHTEAAD